MGCVGGVHHTDTLPHIEVTPGVTAVVDEFQHRGPGTECHYFLTHFHTSQCSGLAGHHVYCSQLTARFVQLQYSVKTTILQPYRPYQYTER